MFDFGDVLSAFVDVLAVVKGWITPGTFLGGAVLVSLGIGVGFSFLEDFVRSARVVAGGGDGTSYFDSYLAEAGSPYMTGDYDDRY